MLTVTDLLVLLVVGLALLRGWYLGLTGFAFRLAGLAAGVLAGLWAAGWLISTPATATAQLLLKVGCALAGAVIGALVGGRIGLTVGLVLNRMHLRLLDRIAGAGARAALALAVCWLLAGLLSSVGPAPVRTAIADSNVLQGVTEALPTGWTPLRTRSDATSAVVGS